MFSTAVTEYYGGCTIDVDKTKSLVTVSHTIRSSSRNKTFELKFLAKITATLMAIEDFHSVSLTVSDKRLTLSFKSTALTV